MTSTNDGKEVKSNQISVQKAKTYYIELYKNLEARLSAESDLEARVGHLCEAWRRVHSLCQHSTPTTHPHLISWLKRHTAHTLLQSEWRLPKNLDKHQTLDAAIDFFIAECHKASASRNGANPDWETQLLQRAKWFKSVISDPWGNAVLKTLLGLSDTSPGAPGTPTDQEIIEWLREERGVFFVTRLRQLGTSKCNDLALKLASAVMERARACAEPLADTEAKPQNTDQDTTSFTDVLSMEAGFTTDVWDLITDIEFVLLYKDRSKCIAVAKQTSLSTGNQLVERLHSRLELSPREKRLWKNSKDVAILIAQVMLARCMVVPTCAGAARSTLYGCSRALVRLLPAERLPAATAALAAPAATARHLHTLAVAVHTQCKNERKPFVCELYIRAITAGMNELERLKLNKDKEEDARAAEQLLSSWFTQLGSLLGGSARLAYECALTAFSLHPSPTMYERIRMAPTLQPHPTHKDVQEPETVTNSEYGSWATDSRSQTNFVKTSETLNLKKTQQHSNVLSTAVLNEGEALGLSPELCQDLIVLLSGPRVKTLSWDMDKEILIENCRSYMERTHGGTKALTTELKYLNLNPDSFMHLPEEEEDEGDIYYGIEKGYEQAMEEQDADAIWENAPTDTERTESCYTTDDETLIPLPRRRKKVRRLSDSFDDEEIDPLSQTIPKPKHRSHSEGSKEKSKERRKEGSKERKKKEKQPRERSMSKGRVRKDKEKPKVSEDCDPLTLDTDKPLSKPKKERKKKERKEKKDPQKKMPTASALSRFIGKKVIRRPAPLNMQEHITRGDTETDFNNQIFITDSDYDSQGKSSIASIHTDGNDPDVLFDGLFSMDEIKSPENHQQTTAKVMEKINALELNKEKAAFTYRESLHQNTGNTASNSTAKRSKNNANSFEQARPLSATPISMQNITDTSRSPSRGSLNLPQNKVKLSIKRLIEFRRQKSATDLTSAVKSVVQPHHNRLNSIVNKKIPNQYELPNSIESGTRLIQSGCPKAISVPSIPKIYINKEQSEQLNLLKSGVDSFLNQSNNAGLESFPMRSPIKKSETRLNNELSSPKSNKLSRPAVTHLNRVENKITAPHQGEPVKVTNSTITSKLAQQSNMKQTPPWQNAVNTEQNNFHDFLKELHRSINAGVSKDNLKVSGLKIEGYIPSSTPKGYSAKPIKTPKKVENAPKTFARLNYMHKNKQGDNISKQNYDQITQNKLQKSSHGQFLGDKSQVSYNNDPLLSRFENTTIKKVEKSIQTKVYSPNNNPHLTRILNSNQSVIKKIEQTEDKVTQSMPTQPSNTTRTTMLTESDQDQLRLLLRQQSKLNISRPQLRSEVAINKGNIHQSKNFGGSASSTTNLQSNIQRGVEDIHNNLQGCQIYNRPNQDLQVPVQNVAILQQRTPTVVQTTEISTNCNRRHKNIPGNTKDLPQNPKDEGKNDSEPQDWEGVLNALLSHKTPSRGQNALDMVLKKDQPPSNSLREQRFRNIDTSKNVNSNNNVANNINRKQENHENSENAVKPNFHLNQRKQRSTAAVDDMSLPANNGTLLRNLSTAVNSTTSVINKPMLLNNQSFAKKSNQTVIIKKHKISEAKVSIEELNKELSNVIQQTSMPNIPSSDYDLLDELMDDDLRQEIGEISSDEENFSSSNMVPKGSKDKSVTSKQTPVEATRSFDPSHGLTGSQNQGRSNKHTNPLLQTDIKISAPVPTSFENTKVINNKPLHETGPLATSVLTSFENTNVIKNKPIHSTMFTPDNRKFQARVQQTKSTISHHAANVVITTSNDPLNQAKAHFATADSSRMSNNIHISSCVQQSNVDCSRNIVNNSFRPSMTVNQNTGNIYTTITQQPAVKNVVLIRPEIILDQLPTVQVHQIPDSMNPTICSLNSSAYVAVNAVPNIPLYSTQFTAPIINPLIVGSTITVPVTQNSTLPVINSYGNTAYNAPHLTTDIADNPTIEKKCNSLEYSHHKSVIDSSKFNKTSMKMQDNPAIEKNCNSLECSHNKSVIDDPSKLNKTSMKMHSHSVNVEPTVVHVADDPTIDVNVNVSTSNKNSERKVLSEVQEKHTINSSETLNSKKSASKITSEDDIKKDYVKTREECIKNKRLAILNRQIHVFNHTKPIALTYAPIQVIKIVPENQEKQIGHDAKITPTPKSQAIIALGFKSPPNARRRSNEVTVDIGNKNIDLLMFDQKEKSINCQSVHIDNSKENKRDGLKDNHMVNTKPEAIIALGFKASSIHNRPLLDQKDINNSQTLPTDSPIESNIGGSLKDNTTIDTKPQVIALGFKSSSIVHKLSEEITMNIINKTDDQKENNDLQTLIPDGEHEKTISNGLKDNKTDTTECKGIKLRSFNKLKVNSDFPQKIETLEKLGAKTKVKLKIKKSKNNVKPQKMDKITKRLMKKKKRSKNTNKCSKKVIPQLKEDSYTLVESTIPDSKLNFDIEEQILGSIIPKNSSLFIDKLKTSVVQENLSKGITHGNVLTGKASDLQIINNTDRAKKQHTILKSNKEMNGAQSCHDDVNSKKQTSNEIQAVQNKSENLKPNIIKTGDVGVSGSCVNILSNIISSKNSDQLNEKTLVRDVDRPEHKRNEDVIIINNARPSVSGNNEIETAKKQGSEPSEPIKVSRNNVTTCDSDKSSSILPGNYANNSSHEIIEKDELNDYYRDKIKIVEMPRKETDDPLKRCMSIKLANGNCFKATVSGKLHVDIDSLFKDPSIRAVLMNNLPSDARCILNIQQIGSKADNNIRTQLVYPEKKCLETINLISDDEEDITPQAFKTEFGKYKIGTLAEDMFDLHQNKFSQKCVVKLQRYGIPTSNSLPEIDNINDMKDTGNTCISEQITLKGKNLQKLCTIPVDNNQQVIEIDDSSNDSVDISPKIHKENTQQLNVSEKIEKDIEELKQKAIEDLCEDVKDNFEMTSTSLSLKNVRDESLENIKEDTISENLCSSKKENSDNELQETALLNNNGNECENVPILIHKEPSTKKCRLNIKKCDDLVKKHQLIQITQQCYVHLERCDRLIRTKSWTKKLEDVSKLESDKIDDTEEIKLNETKTIYDTEDDTSLYTLKRSSSFSILNDFSLDNESGNSMNSKERNTSCTIPMSKCQFSCRDDCKNYKGFEICHSDWYLTKVELHFLTRPKSNNSTVFDDVSTDCDSDLDKSITEYLADDNTIEVPQEAINLVPTLLNLTLSYLENTIELIHKKANKGERIYDKKYMFIKNLKRKSSTPEYLPNNNKILKLNNEYQGSNEASDTADTNQNFNQEPVINAFISNLNSLEDPSKEINFGTREVTEMKMEDEQDIDRRKDLEQVHLSDKQDFIVNTDKTIHLNTEKKRPQDDNSVKFMLKENSITECDVRANIKTQTSYETLVDQDIICPSISVNHDLINQDEHIEKTIGEEDSCSYITIIDQLDVNHEDKTQVSCLELSTNTQKQDDASDANSLKYSNIVAYSDDVLIGSVNTMLKTADQEKSICKESEIDDLNSKQVNENLVENDKRCLPITSVNLDSRFESKCVERQMEPVVELDKTSTGFSNTKSEDSDLDTNTEEHCIIPRSDSNNAVTQLKNTVSNISVQENLFCKDMETEDLNCTQINDILVENYKSCLPIVRVDLESELDNSKLTEPVLKSDKGNNSPESTNIQDESIVLDINSEKHNFIGAQSDNFVKEIDKTIVKTSDQDNLFYKNLETDDDDWLPITIANSDSKVQPDCLELQREPGLKPDKERTTNGSNCETLDLRQYSNVESKDSEGIDKTVTMDVIPVVTSVTFASECINVNSYDINEDTSIGVKFLVDNKAMINNEDSVDVTNTIVEHKNSCTQISANSDEECETVSDLEIQRLNKDYSTNKKIDSTSESDALKNSFSYDKCKDKDTEEDTICHRTQNQDVQEIIDLDACKRNVDIDSADKNEDYVAPSYNCNNNKSIDVEITVLRLNDGTEDLQEIDSDQDVEQHDCDTVRPKLLENNSKIINDFYDSSRDNSVSEIVNCDESSNDDCKIQSDDCISKASNGNDNENGVEKFNETTNNFDLKAKHVGKEDDQIDIKFNESSCPKNITLLYENDSNIVLKGSIIEDPIVGTCYVFPIINSDMFIPSKNDNNEHAEDNIKLNIYHTQNQPELSEVGTKLVEDLDLFVTKPKVTYSKTGFKVKCLPKDTCFVDKARKCLKRKIEGQDSKTNQKKYRKGKNIDYPKITVAAMCECAYSKEFRKLSSYCSSIKFSYSKDYHLIQIEDVHTMLEDWPIKQSHLPTLKITDTDTDLFIDKLPKTLPDPAKQTLAEEISAKYEEDEIMVEEINETNFSMGFGERSGRVNQNLKDGGESTKFSAATLSDVKQSQPFLQSVDTNKCDIPKVLSSRQDELQKINKCYSYIKLRNKVKAFFRETTAKLRSPLKNNNIKMDKINSNQINLYDSMVDFLCDLDSTNFFEPPFTESIVQVVQVGQLPVSTAAQNPVTCDPRVTQVSDASPAQCSVDNASHEDMQPAIKTEYTELTTADISLPLMADYEHHQAILPGSQISNSPISNDNITIETEVKIEVLDEVPENMDEQSCYDNRDYTGFQTEQVANNEYTYDENDMKVPIKTEPDVKIVFEPLGNDPDNSQPESFQLQQQQQQQQQNGLHEKPDQLAHAMNAAGITTTSESTPDTAMDLSNTLPRSMCSNSDDNSYQRSTITALALQQALAQILPPPLNQSGETESNTPVSVASQILHIVHGKNSSLNQLSSPDNTQPSVVNTPNPTPVLHIVQNKSGTTTSTTDGSPVHNSNSYNNLSLVDAGLSQGGSQLLHIVNTGNQKVNNTTQLLKRVNLLTNLANVQGSNEQKMVQFVCKSTDAKGIQLNTHQRSMVLRLHPIEPTQATTPSKPECPEQNIINREPPPKEPVIPPEIKSRSVYEENYAQFIQNSSKINIEKSTSLPKFNQAFGKPVFQEDNQKPNEIGVNDTHLSSVETNIENNDCQSDHSLQISDNVRQIGSPPLLLRKSTNPTSQAQQNLVQQIKQAITPMNIQTMHGGVIYTRQIPVNLGGGQTINLITVPNTDRVDDSVQKQKPDVKFGNRSEIEQSIIKIVPQSPAGSNGEMSTEESNNSAGVSNESSQNSQPPPMLTQMRIKLPMLSKNTQMVTGGRVVRPSFFQIQRNVIGGANQPVYQQLVLTAAPTLGQQPIRLPQTQTNREMKVGNETQASPESQMSSSTLEQLREFDMVLEQVKERSTVQPNSAPPNEFPRSHTPSTSTDTTDNASSSTPPETTQQVLYSIGNNQPVNVAYINRKSTVVSSPATTSFARSPDSSGIVESPTSSSHVPTVHVSHTVTSESTSDSHTSQSHHKPIKVSSKSKSRPKSHHPQFKINPVPPKPSNQKPMEDEQTTQRILYILAEYKEQVENSPDKDKPAPRRRTNLQAAPPSGSSKRKKSSSGSRRSGRDSSPIDDNCRTMGSEDSSCGTSQGDCSETCLETHSPQGSPRKVAKKLTFEQDPPASQSRPQAPRNVLVTDGPTLAVTRGAPGKPATAVLMPANYILPVSMVKSGQQIAIVTNRGPKILTVGGGESGATNALLLQRLIGPAGLKPMLTRPGVRHVRLPTAAFHNLQAFNLTTATNAQPADSAASPAPATSPPDLIDTNAPRSPWTAQEQEEVKPERDSSPEEQEPDPEPEPWNVPQDYSYEETVRTEMDRTVLDAIPDRYSPDMEAQRIFDKMFDVESKKDYIVESQDDSPRCPYDIDASDCDDKAYHQVVQRRDGVTNRHRLVSAATLRQKFALMEDELRLQKSLSEECEDLGVDSPSASELFPEAELLFSSSPAHETPQQSHTPQPVILNQSTTIPQPDMDDQVATDQLISEENEAQETQTEIDLGLEDVGIVTVSEDGRATISLDHEEFVRSHPNTTFHSEPTEDGEIQAVTIDDLKARHITSTIFHASRAPATVLVSAPQTVISQATPGGGVDRPPPSHSTPTGNAHVIRRLRRDRTPRYLLDDTDHMIGSDSKMGDDSSATLDSIDDDRSSPERTELFWETHANARSDNFSSDSDKCCKSPYDENNSTDSSGIGAHMRLDSVIKDARGIGGDVDDGNVPPLRTYPPKRTYHDIHERSHSRHHESHDRLSSRIKPDDRFSDSLEIRRRASNRGVVKRGCHCCNGAPAPPKPKKPRQKKPTLDFN